jgi:integrase/recombinase XerD
MHDETNQRARRDWALSATQRNDARLAIGILDGSGMTLEMAARVALNGRVAPSKKSVSDAVASFLSQRMGERVWRPSTAEWFDRRLQRLVDEFGERRISDLQPGDLNEWLGAMTIGARPGYFRAVRALFTWAVRQDPPFAASSPTQRMEVPPGMSREGDIHFLKVDECAKILAGAGPYLGAIALSIFAGLRPEEVAPRDKPGLQWSHVNEREKRIRVPGDVAKITGQARVIEGLPPALWRWLKTIKGKDGLVSPGRSRQIAQVCKRTLGLEQWPHDVLRHTFATYAASHTQDPGQVATWLGHQGNPTMLFRHYNGLATKADARKFWALSP